MYLCLSKLFLVKWFTIWFSWINTNRWQWSSRQFGSEDHHQHSLGKYLHFFFFCSMEVPSDHDNFKSIPRGYKSYEMGLPRLIVGDLAQFHSRNPLCNEALPQSGIRENILAKDQLLIKIYFSASMEL